MKGSIDGWGKESVDTPIEPSHSGIPNTQTQRHGTNVDGTGRSSRWTAVNDGERMDSDEKSGGLSGNSAPGGTPASGYETRLVYLCDPPYQGSHPRTGMNSGVLPRSEGGGSGSPSSTIRTAETDVFYQPSGGESQGTQGTQRTTLDEENSPYFAPRVMPGSGWRPNPGV